MSEQSSNPRTFVVGIAGGSASGKSTFTAALLKTLEATAPQHRVEVLMMDRYFYRGAEGGPTFVSPSTGQEMPDNNHPDSADNARLVQDVKARCAAEDRPNILIVEGLMALHVPALRECFDLRLFLELDADERALRRLLRDMSGVRGNTDPKFIATYYRECARVGHARYVEPSRVHADLILRGDADFARTAPLIASLLSMPIRENETMTLSPIP